MNFLIYKITNLVNGKIYIGQTVKIFKGRMGEHFISAKNGSQCAIHRAIRKYGTDNFTFETICECLSKEESNQKEMDLIREFNSKSNKIGYNMTDGGEGTLGRKPTEKTLDKMRKYRPTDETKAKIGIANKGNKYRLGKKFTDETKAKMSATKKGKQTPTGWHHTEEAKAKMSLANKGNKYWLGKKHTDETKLKLRNRIVSEETRAKLRITNLGKKATPEKLAKMRAIKISEETRAKLSAALTGRKVSEKTRGKLSAATTLWRQRKREMAGRVTA